MPVEVSCSTPAKFSPDGHRLVFWISESPDPATVPPVTRLGLFDWSSQTSRIPEGLNQRLSLHPGSLCWNEHDGRLHIGGFFATDILTTRWFQLDPESGSDFRPSNPPTGQCQANPPPLWESHRPVTHTPDIERAVVILSPRETEVVISLQDGAELTRHRSLHVGSRRIYVSQYVWSPTGQYLAYLVGESKGAWTAGPNRAYLTTAQGEGPWLLGTGFYTLTWRDDEHLIGCGRRVVRRERGLAHWRAPEAAAVR